jgi:peptide/nickel transport system permease protein
VAVVTSRVTEREGAPATRRRRSNPTLWIGLAMAAAIVLLGLLSPVLSPSPPNATNFLDTLAPPGPGHLLGTDNLGRDELSRLLSGTVPSLLSAVGAVALALVAGTLIGLVAAYLRGSFWDDALMRLMDAVLALPALVLAIAVAFVLGSGALNAVLAIATVFTPPFARLARAKALQVRELGYVEAARALGAGDGRIMFAHILPNSMGPSIAAGALQVASAVIIEASLSFLGLGLAPPAPTWGFMISAGVTYLGQAPWLVIVPSAGIAVSVFAFTLIGRGLQEWT